MSDSPRAQDYVHFLSQRYRLVLMVVGAALATAAVACLLLPKKFTATATLLIDPPGTGDPRLSTAVSPAYLESLKSFEQFASSDSLFLRACEKFHLLASGGGSTVERFKQSVLQVEKPKDTRLLRLSVTLRDARLSQAVAQYMAEQTVLLNRGLVKESEQQLADDVARQLAVAKAALDQTREAAASLGGTESQMEEDTLDLRHLNEATQQQAMEASVEAAESTAQQTAVTGTEASELDYLRRKAAAAKARQAALATNQQELARRLAEKEAAWVTTRARRQRADGELNNAEAAYNELRKRANDLASSAGLRSEQLRIIDSGIVPQRPSAPDIPLILAAAFVLSLTAALVMLALQYRMSRAPAQPARTQFRIARGGR